MTRRRATLAVVVLAAVAACSSRTSHDVAVGVSATEPIVSTSIAEPSTTGPTSTAAGAGPSTVVPPGPDAVGGAVPPPEWIGTRVLETTADGFGRIVPTPPELVDRRFLTEDVLPPPTTVSFDPTVAAVNDAVLARSTWSPDCPVDRSDLRYVTVPFWGFDQRLHTGELLVNADAVDAVLAGFAVLFDDRFPIEEMRITSVDDLDAPPTGDGNNTSAFVCRAARGATSWSQHAYGRAVDVNPFHNPYVKGDLVLPELASAYADRSERRPGMLDAHAVRGFTGAGWTWGGSWRSFVDTMHVSATGS